MANRENTFSPINDIAREWAEATLYVPAKPLLEKGLGSELPSRCEVLGRAAYNAATLPIALAAATIIRGGIKL